MHKPLLFYCSFCATFLTVRVAGVWDATFESTFPAEEACTAIVATSGSVYVGTWNGTVLQWTPGGGWSYMFDPNSTTAGGPIFYLGLWGGFLYAGGSFTVGLNVGQPLTLNHIAKININTGELSSVGGGLSGYARLRTMIVAQSESKYRGDFLYVGGVFDLAGGQAMNNVASYNGIDWSDLAGGLPISPPSQVTDGVHNLVVITTTSKRHQVLAGGRFDLGPNVAIFTESGTGGVWQPAGIGVGDVILDSNHNCDASFVQGFDTYVTKAVRKGNDAYLMLFDATHVNGYYQAPPCPPGPGYSPCGCPLGWSTAKLSIPMPNSLGLWDGGQGWSNVQIFEIWSNGISIFAYADFLPFGGSPTTIATYNGFYGLWSDLTVGGLDQGFSPGPNSMAVSSLGLFLATQRPKRWQ